METMSETLVLNRNTVYIDRNMFQDCEICPQFPFYCWVYRP